MCHRLKSRLLTAKTLRPWARARRLWWDGRLPWGTPSSARLEYGYVLYRCWRRMFSRTGPEIQHSATAKELLTALRSARGQAPGAEDAEETRLEARCA